MHQRRPLKFQGVFTQQGASTLRTSQGQASGLTREPGRSCLYLPAGARLWTWLVLGALVVPGAWSFLSEEQEELLVELHNHYRGQVSPSASAMLPLRWDPTLKLLAENYAAKCIWNHNPDLLDIGENLFVTSGPLDLREALEKWFLEHLDYDFSNNSCDEDKMCGHYTQMVWADTHRVGCAFHPCNNMEGLDWERVSFLACNYYPAGNYEDERPYVEGDWCSRCPENLQTCENNLCVPDTPDEDVVEEEDDVEEEENEEEEEVVFPPQATPEPSPAEEEEENVAPPSTADVYTQPATTTITTTTTTIATTTPSDTQPPATPMLSTPPPMMDTTPLDEVKPQEKVGEEDEIMETGKKVDAADKTEQGERDITKNIYQNQVLQSSGSVWSASVPLVCPIVFFTLRL